MKLIVAIGFSLILGCESNTALASSSEECTTASHGTDVSIQALSKQALPLRNEPRTLTSGRVPHVQVNARPVKTLNDRLHRRVFMLPGVQARPTIVSLPGTTGMWLADDIPVQHSKAIVSGREFSHIHTDGSLHTPLPVKRAFEVQQKGWGERHPWADRNEGWQGLVMLYSARTEQELDVLVQLITESYNHVTGLNVQPPAC